MSEDQKAVSPAERQRTRMDALLAAIDSRSEMLTTLLADSGIEFPRFVEVVRRALIKNPDLIECDAASFIEACINACTDGLLPDGREGAIVVYNVNVANRRKKEPDRWVKKANFQSMYQGLLKIAYASGNFRSIEARVVYEGDSFEYDLGDEPFIKHRPKVRSAGTTQPAIVAAYAVAKTVNGGVFREVFEGADIEKVNKVSKATNGPGASWPEEMARKGPLRRMWKFLPKNEAMNRIVERDNEGFDLGALADETAPVREKRLSAGFAPVQQLTQGADPVMPDLHATESAELVDVGGASGEDLVNSRRAPGAQEGAHPGHPKDGAGALDPTLERGNARGPGANSVHSGAQERGGSPDDIGVVHVEGDDGVAAPHQEGTFPLQESNEPEEVVAGHGHGSADIPASPEVSNFRAQLSAATSWLNVKQALKTFAKTEMGADERAERAAKLQAWTRMGELREAGQDKTDFVSDPILFECWLLGSDPEPDHDSIEGNWAIVQADKAFEKLAEEDRARILARVGEALGSGDAGAA